MKLNSSLLVCILGPLFWVAAPVLNGQQLQPIVLLPPQLTATQTLMRAVQERHTTREFTPQPLPPQMLSDLLWSAFGINRPATGQRTAPSAMDSQETDIYVALPEGLYLYEAKPHRLKPLQGGDLRAKTSGQAFATNSSLTLIFVADLSRLAKARPEMRPVYANFDAGCISQNVSLYCAAAGLGSVVHDLDRAPLSALLQLRPEQRIMMAQAVGFPK